MEKNNKNYLGVWSISIKLKFNDFGYGFGYAPKIHSRNTQKCGLLPKSLSQDFKVLSIKRTFWVFGVYPIEIFLSLYRDLWSIEG
jgi:hypothetical protein